MGMIEDGDDTHPYRLVTAPAQNFLNTSFTETPTSNAREGRPTVLVHPQELIALGGEELAEWLMTNFGNIFGDALDESVVTEHVQGDTTLHLFPCRPRLVFGQLPLK